MGNSSKKPEHFDVVNTYNRQQWLNKEKRNGFEIWQNTRTNVRADVYPIHHSLDSNDLENYQLRKNNSSNIVKVHHIGFQKKQNLCSKSSEAVILTERIPVRLDAINNLTQQEALCVLRSAYNGFNTLGSFYGPIEPYEDMICFNEQGRPKVWLNSNLSINEPEKKRQDESKKDLSDRNHIYVNKILDMVQNKTTGYRLADSLKNKFRQIGPKNYFEAINIIEEYAAENRIKILSVININPQSSLRGSMVSQIANNTSQQYSQHRIVSNYSPSSQNINIRSTANGPLNFGNNYNHSVQSYRPPPHTQYRQNIQSVSHIMSPRVQNRSRQISFSSNIHPHHQYPTPQKPNTVMSPHLANSQHYASNSIVQRSRSGQLRPFINSNTSLIQPTYSPRLVIPPVPVHSTTRYAAPQSTKFDSPSKVIFNQQIHYNRMQQPVSPTNQGQLIVKDQEEQEISNSESIQKSPTKLGHVRKQDSQEFVTIVQQRVDVQLPQYISITEAKKAQQQQQQRKQTRQQNSESGSLHRMTQSDNLIRESAKSLPSAHQQCLPSGNEQFRPSGHQQQLQEHQQKYIDDLEEEQASQEDEYEQNANQQYAEYIRKQKIREEEQEYMREEMRRYEEGDVQSSGQAQNEEVDEQQNVNGQYLMRKDSNENQQDEIVNNNSTNTEYQRIFIENQSGIPQRNNTKQSYKEEQNQIIKQFKQLQNATSQQYFIEDNAENSQGRNQRIQKQISSNTNIQRVVSMEKKMSQFSSLGASAQIKKDYEEEYEIQREEPIQVESEYMKGEKSYEKNSLAQIPEDARYEDIEAYIKQKYSSYLRSQTDDVDIIKPAYKYETKQKNQEEDYDVRKMAVYVQSKYDQMRSSKSGERRDSFNKRKQSINDEQRISDMLDVRNMERSLDKKYNSMKSQPKIQDEAQNDDNQFDIKKLQENLIRFEESRVGGGVQAQNTSQVQNFETSQVSKIVSFEDRVNRRNSSISRQMNFKQQNSYTYILDKDNRKPSSNYSGIDRERDSFMINSNHNAYTPPLSINYQRNSKISKFLDSIDQKFDKYVNNNTTNQYKNPQKHAYRYTSDVNTKRTAYYEANKKNYDNYSRNYEPENENNYISSRLATAKFQYAQSDEGKKNILEPKSNLNKGLTYDEMRKYMWS